MTSKARPEDVDEICAGLPETELGTSWGDRPTWKVPTGDKGFWYKLACAAQRVIMMAAAYAPNTSKRVANLIQVGLLTCSLRCLPHAGANPDPVVEGLRSFLPYLYTSRALFAIERAPELQSYWSEPPPLLFGGSQEVWPAYMAAITRDREAYVLRGDRSTPMCSNLQVRLAPCPYSSLIILTS